MYSRKSSGPKTLPCGTPEVTSVVVEDLPSTSTYCARALRKAEIHLVTVGFIP